MKSRILCFASLFLVFGIASSANAQFKLGAQAGIADFESFYLGANIVLPLGLEVADQTLSLNGDFDYVLESNVTWIIIDGNLLYPFNMDGNFKPYAGAGLVINIISIDTPDFDFDFDDLFNKRAESADEVATQATNTDFGLNLKGGFEYEGGGIIPFGEAGFYLMDGGFLYLQGGVRFVLGG